MRGYISTDGSDGTGRIALDGKTELYRRGDGSHEVVVDTGDREVPLGVADVTVSRKKDGVAPVVITPRSEFVEVRNAASTNPVSVTSEADGRSREVERGRVATVERDAVIEVGYQTRLRLVLERDRKVHHEGEGDVVLGDRTTVDNSTHIDDAVINRSNVGGDGGADVEDAAINRSNVGGDGGADVEDAAINRSNAGSEGNPTVEAPVDRPDDGADDTRSICQTHGVTYDGQQCPQCADSRETKFCIYCGEEIPGPARHCPACGEELPE